MKERHFDVFVQTTGHKPRLVIMGIDAKIETRLRRGARSAECHVSRSAVMRPDATAATRASWSRSF